MAEWLFHGSWVGLSSRLQIVNQWKTPVDYRESRGKPDQGPESTIHDLCAPRATHGRHACEIQLHFWLNNDMRP